MSNRQIASLAFKIAGIYTLIQALHAVESLTPWLSMIFSGMPIMGMPVPSLVQLGVGATPFGLMLLGGVVLIAASGRFARYSFPESGASEGPHPPALFAFIYSAIGLYIGIYGLAGLVRLILGLAFALSRGGPGFTAVSAQYVPSAVGSLLELILGILLFARSHWVAHFWANLRYAGLRRKLGLCVRCGYDLTGNLSGRCPECGEPVSPEEPIQPVGGK